MKKKFLLLVSLSLFVFYSSTYSQEIKNKSKLSILYVGGSANWENVHFKNEEDRKADIQRRTASFESMLNHYFTSVKTIDAKEYRQEMSNEYDVTVIDGTPKAITEVKETKDASGKTITYIPESYFTEDFNHPMLFIGGTGATLGRSLGLKCNWYCLCLDANALNTRLDHEIFKGPFAVKINQEIKPTPPDAFHYEYFLGHKTPETIPMWRVQTKGYVTEKGFRIGMVSQPWGFEDSPDAEYISSGVCQKTLDAVALGRHGNFFHWGFAASPEYMTDEGQTVLANAICYISKFNGKGVIAREYLGGRATREYLKERKYYATTEAYKGVNGIYVDFNRKMLEENKKINEKKAKGETLTRREESSLNYKPFPEQTLEEFLRKYHGDLYDRFGRDSEAYAKYYDENKDYFYGEDALYKMSLDEDVKSLGIPYYEKRLLDKAIGMLEKGKDVEKAKRILNRYTMVDFNTPAKWRNWYEKNKNRMFFTETGGYYFMINTYDKTIAGNDYQEKALRTNQPIKYW